MKNIKAQIQKAQLTPSTRNMKSKVYQIAQNQ